MEKSSAAKILEHIIGRRGGQLIITKSSAAYLLSPYGGLGGPFMIEDYQPLIDAGVFIPIPDGRPDLYTLTLNLYELFSQQDRSII